MNTMQTIRIEKLTLNFGAGKDNNLLNKGVKLLKMITGINPVQAVTQKRIPQWGLRPGLHVGCKITLRGKEAEELLPRLLDAKEFILTEKNFDQRGTVSFGIPEYIDIPGVEYDPEIGIIGFEVMVTLQRPGFRVKRKRIRSAKIGVKHQIKQADSIKFMTEKFKVKFEEDEE